MDELDAIFDKAHGVSTAPAAPAPEAAPSPSVDLDAIFAKAHATQGNSGGWQNEALAIGNRGVEAATGLVELADAANRNLNPLFPGGARYFGLNETPLNTPKGNLGEEIKKAADYVGLYGPEQAQTELGKFGEIFTKNAVSAAPFGPLAMAGSGILGGTGGYYGKQIGEEFGEPVIGENVGSFITSLSPAAVSKIKLVKEIGEWLGPTLSQYPGIRALFGNTPVKAAVGRAVAKNTADLAGTEAAIREATEFVGPRTPTEALRTSADYAPELGVLEDATQQMGVNAPFGTLARERAGARAESVLGDIADTAPTPYETSKALESTMVQAGDTVKGVADDIWRQLDEDLPVTTNIPEVADDLARNIDEITLSGEVPLDELASGLRKRALNLGTDGQASMGAVQQLKARVGQEVRNSSKRATLQEQTRNDVMHALSRYLDNLVDVNVERNLMPAEQAQIWRAGRGATQNKYQTFSAPKQGIDNRGTRALEQLVIKETPLDNTTLLREGMGSPDKMATHINAAATGGQDVRPLYQEALKAELANIPQSGWRKFFNKKRNFFELAFDPAELQRMEREVADYEMQAMKGADVVSARSNTAGRTNVIEGIREEKGLANLISGKFGSVPAIVGAYQGGKLGWENSDNPLQGAGQALILGLLGAAAGKGLKIGAKNSSATFDELLVAAQRDPKIMLEALEAARPSNFSQQVSSALFDTAKVAAAKEGGRQVNKYFGGIFTEKQPEESPTAETPAEGQAGPAPVEQEKSPQPTNNTVMGDVFSRPDMENKPPSSEVQNIDEGKFLERTSEVANSIGVDPNDLLKVMHFETGGTFDPAQKNKAGSSGTGLIQFMGDTAQRLTGEETKAEALRFLSSMTATEQLDYVEKYLSPYKGKINSLDDLYMAILYPRAIGKDSEYPLFKRGSDAYDKNKGLDANRDGSVTKEEAASRVRAVKV